jgi:SOS-response transcriptional repressor LexA
MDFLSAGKSMVWDRHTCNNHSISVHRHAKPCGQNEYITSSDNKAMALHIQQLLQHALLYERNGCLALGSGRQRKQQADHNLLLLLTIYKPDVVHTQASAGHFQSCQTSTSNLA